MSALPAAAVLFDLDGTLVDTAPDIADAANHMLAALGRPTCDEKTVMGWIGDGIPRLIKRALTGEPFKDPDEDLFQSAYTLFGDFYEKSVAVRSQLYPHATETLRSLHEAGFALACVTNKAARFTEPLLATLGLRAFFTLVLSGDSLIRVKPDPLPVVVACARLGVTLEGAVLVGDSGNDMRAAKAADVRAIALTTGYHHGADLKGLGAQILVDDLIKIPELLYFEPQFRRSQVTS